MTNLRMLLEVCVGFVLAMVLGCLGAVGIAWLVTDSTAEFWDLFMYLSFSALLVFTLGVFILTLGLQIHFAVERNADANKEDSDGLSSDICGLRSDISVSITYKDDSEEEVCRNKDTSTSVGANT